MKNFNLKRYKTLNILSLLGYISFFASLYIIIKPKSIDGFSVVTIGVSFLLIHLFTFCCWVLENDTNPNNKPIIDNLIYSFIFYTGLILNISIYIVSEFITYVLTNIIVCVEDFFHNCKMSLDIILSFF